MILKKWQEEIVDLIKKQPRGTGKSVLIAYLFLYDDGAKHIFKQMALSTERMEYDLSRRTIHKSKG